jgi:hypothetical protein
VAVATAQSQRLAPASFHPVSSPFHGPEPTPGPGELPSGLVAVLGLGLADVVGGLGVGRAQRRGDLALEVADRPQGEPRPQGLDQLPHAATAGVVPADQVAQECRQARPGDMGGDRLGDRLASDLSAGRADPGLAAMLGDDEDRGGQVDDLVPGRLGIDGPGPDRERRPTAGAGLGDVINDRIDAFRGDLLAPVALMPGLATATSLGRRLGLGPGGVWRVGRRRDR